MIDLSLIILSLGSGIMGTSILLYECSKNRSNRDFLAPSPFLAYWLLLTTPGYLSHAINPNDLYATIEAMQSSKSAADITTQSTLLILLSYIFILFGHRSFIRRIYLRGKLFQYPAYFFLKGSLQHSGTFIFLLGSLMWVFVKIVFIGDLTHLWEDLHLRTQLTSGIAYFTSFMTTAIYLSVILLTIQVSRNRYTLSRRISFFFVVIVSFFFLASLGGRGPAIGIAILSVLTFNFYDRSFAPFNLKIAATAMIMLLFILLSGLPRLSDISVHDFYENPALVAKKTLDVAEERLFRRLASLDRVVIIVTYFNEEPPWLGASYSDLFRAPIPRGMLDEKPPVDDGIYVYNMSLGSNVEPNLALERYHYNSIPPGNWAGYMNGLLAGLLIVSYLSGALSAFLYRCTRRTKDPYWILLYGTIGSWGIVTLSVYGVVRILTAIAMGLSLLVIAGLGARVFRLVFKFRTR